MNFRITFQERVGRAGDSWSIYCSMAEGMWTNARDDNETDRVRDLDALMNEIDKQQPKVNGVPSEFCFQVFIAGHLEQIARDVLDNCLDNYGGDEEDTLEDGDVLIEEVA
jgi:hypothetical protein